MANLLDLPDEIIVKILLYNHHDSVLDIGAVGSRRLDAVLSQTALWTNVEFRKPVALRTLKTSLKYMGPHTKSIRITGNLKSPTRQYRPVLKSNTSHALFSDIKKKCPRLQELNLDFLFMNSKNCTLEMHRLPDSLEQLNLSSCVIPTPVTGDRWVTRGIDQLMNLRELTLYNCNWFSLVDLAQCLRVKQLTKLMCVRCDGFSTVQQEELSKFCQRNKEEESSVTIKLSLIQCGIGSRHLAAILPLLTRVRHLNLENNNIGTRGLEILAQSMREDHGDGGYQRIRLDSLDYNFWVEDKAVEEKFYRQFPHLKKDNDSYDWRLEPRNPGWTLTDDEAYHEGDSGEDDDGDSGEDDDGVHPVYHLLVGLGPP